MVFIKIKYPKVIHFGEEITEFFKRGNLHIEEKIDGSQFRIWIDGDTIECGSKGVDWSDERPHDKMFNLAIEATEKAFKGYPLKDTMIFAEFLMKPKHNTMFYERVPEKNLIIFDVCEEGRFLDYEEKCKFAENWGFEVVPCLWSGDGKKLNMKVIEKLLENDFILGREKIEGMVFKNYNKMWQDGYQAGKPIILKYVKEEFKERNKKEWKGNTKKGLIDMIIEELRTKARWDKAIQHMRDEEKLTNSPKDIGLLMKELASDLELEEGEQIKKRLLDFFLKEIRKGVIKGFPEYYKKRLLEESLT